MRRKAVLIKSLSMVSRYDDQGFLPQSHFPKVIKQPPDLCIDVRKAVRVEIFDCIYLVLREVTEADRKVYLFRTEAARKPFGSPVRKMAVLKVYVHKERLVR